MARVGESGVVRFIRGTGAATDVPDAELVRRFAADADEPAFRTLVGRYGPVVWGVCRRLLRDHHDAEDAFQATFLVLARGAGGIRAGAAIGGWLCGVAARVAVRVRNSRRLPTDAPEPAHGHPDGVLGELTVREAEAVLHEELAALPEKYRGPVVLCCLEGLSRDEAAARLGWSANRVKHGLERGRDRLRSRLAHRGIALGVPLLAGLLDPPPAAAVPPPLADAVVRHATGAPPPAAVLSLVHGVTRTMWIAKWKWAAAGCAAVVLAAGGTLAALSPAPDAPPAPPAAANLVLVPAPAQPPKAAPAPKAEPKPAWDVAYQYLELVLNNRPADAAKLFAPGVDADRYIKELQVAGFKRIKFVMFLVNDGRVMVVTERAKLRRAPNADPEDDHVTVTLERADAKSPWLVRENDVAREGAIRREMGGYLEGKFDFDPPAKPDKKGPVPAVEIAAEFLALALVEKDADALKLTVPGTISENKVGEVRRTGIKDTRFRAVLVNDTRAEVIYPKQTLVVRGSGETAEVCPVLMVTRGKGDDAPWQVKDIDLRDDEALEPRLALYLGGKYDTPPPKP